MQERGANTVNMDNDTETEDLSAPQASRGRNNSKLANKLVRSHAMREEASPPRDVLVAAAAAAASAQRMDDGGATTPTTPRACATPNTLSPPIQHRIRSPPELGGGSAHARTPCGNGGGGNPVLVLSPSASPSALHQTTNASTSPPPTTTTTHNIQCSYHHQQQQCNYHNSTTTAVVCNVQTRASPTNNGGGTSPSLSTAHRCCSPQQQQQQQQQQLQQQMLLTVDYVSGDSGDDRGVMMGTGDGTSHKVAKLNRQNLDLCTTKQRNPSSTTSTSTTTTHNATILEESSQQQSTKVPKCDCNLNNNNYYQSSHQQVLPECQQRQQQQQQHIGNGSVGGGTQLGHHYSNGGGSHNNQLTVSRGNRAKLRQESSSQSYGSFDGSHSSMSAASMSASPCLSRDNSSEQYTDNTGVDLDTFIPETLNRNAKDRALMLRIEEELVSLAKDQTRTHYKFPPMSSYQRMLVHRCAAYFGMDHNIESSGKCVVVNRTKATRIPNIPFKEHLRIDACLPPSNYSNNGSATGSTTSLINAMDADQQQQQQANMRRSILKRGDNNNGGSMDEIASGGGRSRDMMMLLSAGGSGGDKRSKSFEEREEEYAKVRRRIFNPMIDHDHRGGSQDEFRWSDVHWPSTDSDVSTRNKLHPMEHHHQHRCRPLGRLQKVQSEEKGEDTLRPCVAKSYSFGGYGGCFTRGDSIMSTHSASPRLLTKQDSSSSSTYHPHHHHHHAHHQRQLSPSSSGYKTQSSQRSTESVTPSPTSTPYLPTTTTSTTTSHRQDSSNTNVSSSGTADQLLDIVGGGGTTGTQQMVFWAVTDVDSVPKGSVIINPATGMAVRNDDGSVYRYDPSNLPVGIVGGGSAGKGGSGGEGTAEKHMNYVETKMLLPEPLMEEPPLCSNDIVLVQNHSPKRHGKPPLSPSHYHNQHHQIESQSSDEQLSYQQQEMVELVECQPSLESVQTLRSPSHESPQRRRRNSPFKKQENFAQASMDKPIMVSTYTSTSSPSPLSYSPPPPPPQPPVLTQAPISTPRPSRPSSVLSQRHTPTNNNNNMQQLARYGQQPNVAYQQQQQVMVPMQEQQQQQQQVGYLMGQPPHVYSEAVVYGSGGGGGGGGGGMQPAPPCFVYGYGVPAAAGFNPVQMENGLPDVGMNMNMGVGGYYIADGAGAAGTITYQPWAPNQPATISYFAAPGPPVGAQPPTMSVAPPAPSLPGTTARFSVPMHAQPASYLAPSQYTTHHPAAANYITCPAAAAAAAAAVAHQPAPTELIPLYSPVPPGHQPHVMYAPHPSTVTAPGIAAGQLYPTAMYGGGNMPYTPPPQQAGPALLATPQHQQQYYSASSATSTPLSGHHMGAFTYPVGAPTPPLLPSTMAACGGGAVTPVPFMGYAGPGQGFVGPGIVHGMGQMSLSGGGKGRSAINTAMYQSHHLDRRNSMQRMRVPTPNAGQSATTSSVNRGFYHQQPPPPPPMSSSQGGCSSQSSTEPSSPATTIVPPYRFPPTSSGTDTPPIIPTGHVMVGGPQHFMPIQQQQQQQGFAGSGMVIRPMNTMHSSPPITTMSRSSRSPTPAGSDISLVGDRPKFPTLPAAFAGVYHPTGVPFMFPADVRFGMRSPFRQLSPHQRPVQQALGTDRGIRNRKPRGNKQFLPPNGRPNM